MTTDDLKKIKALYADATPGPWHWSDLADSSGGCHESIARWGGPGETMADDRQWYLGQRDFGAGPTVMSFGDNIGLIAEDADLIAASRSVIPELVSEVEKLRGAVAYLLATGEIEDVSIRRDIHEHIRGFCDIPASSFDLDW